MNELDVYYRALLGYRKNTTESDKCTALRAAIAASSQEGDKITVKTASCTIEEDWVKTIEEGLVHVEKAIKMERQFIRSNGEVLPIEKVKNVSKESVEHLAKHGNLITRYSEGEDIVPDKLYTVERLNDYAVYENRFLYMLLCYLREFVSTKYNEIVELTNMYEATVCFDKTVINGKQRMTYQLCMHDVRREDEYLKAHNPSKHIIDRIGLILKTVLAFLDTPLMVESGKAPMLKPPITKTNVLKMNTSFKGAVALYEFIISYDKKGYEIEEKQRIISPFGDELADEIAEAGGMLSFLTYEWGLGIKPDLKASYIREEERRGAEEVRQRAESIATMQRRLRREGIGIEEYVITLEKQVKALEGESERAEALADEVDRLREAEKNYIEEISLLNSEIESLKQMIIEERKRHLEEIETLKKTHDEEIRELEAKCESKIAEINDLHEKDIAELKDNHEREILKLTSMHEDELSGVRDSFNTEIEKMKACNDEEIRKLNETHAEQVSMLEEEHRSNEQIYEARIEEVRNNASAEVSSIKEEHAMQAAEINGRLQDMSDSLDELRSQYDTLLEAKRIAEARVKAVIGVDKDLTDKANFTELEHEFNAFRRLYKEQWAKTRRRIRKDHLSIQNIKGQTEKNEDSD